MVIDNISNSKRYTSLYPHIMQAFNYLHTTDLNNIAPGKYAIDGDNVFAIVQEYTTLDAANEQMEAHRKYIDVQYMIIGTELVGHAFLADQKLSKEYNEQEDFLLVPDAPNYFTKLEAGIFMIFSPTDLHMPCIQYGAPATVKKVVVKVKI
ncbi:MAG: YhcH/YjgK/YiaL family protein [Taibaiella sp.]|nr:YhcH/YjgK/YiaL family protein [Taibaiella sp.]